MAFSPTVAANYTASFRPVAPAPGFSQVKSDLAANYLMQVPMLRQQMEMSMAKQALSEAGANIRNERNIDLRRDLADMELKRAEKVDKINKLVALAAMGGEKESGMLDSLNLVDAFTNKDLTAQSTARIANVADAGMIGARMNQVRGDGSDIFTQGLSPLGGATPIAPATLDQSSQSGQQQFGQYFKKALQNAIDSGAIKIKSQE